MTDAKANLRKNFDWYYANLDSLLPEYSGRYIAFSDGKVIGAFDDFIVAAQSAIDRGHPLGTFAVHKCIPKSEEKPLVFASSFADFSSPTSQRCVRHAVLGDGRGRSRDRRAPLRNPRRQVGVPIPDSCLSVKPKMANLSNEQNTRNR